MARKSSKITLVLLVAALMLVILLPTVAIAGVYNYPTASIGAGTYTARVYLMAQDGTFTYVDSVLVTVSWARTMTLAEEEPAGTEEQAEELEAEPAEVPAEAPAGTFANEEITEGAELPDMQPAADEVIE